jgi:peptide/nickel transport system permease protein
MGAIWKSRGMRKFRKSKLAVASAVVITAYVFIAGLVAFGLISREMVENRVGAMQVPGFGITQSHEKRWDDIEFFVNQVARSLRQSKPKEALAELRYGRITVADRSVDELRRTVADANAIMDKLAESDDINEDEALWPEVDRLEEVAGSLFAQPEGWDGFVQSMLLFCGTDRQGRSILARGLYAVKVAVQIGVIVGLFAVLFGALLGAAAAYFGSWVDHVVIWLYSTLSAIPYLVLLGVLIFMFAGTDLENSLVPLYVAFGLTFWIGPCRVIRGEALRIKELDYVMAANALGQKRGVILMRHILPNVSHLVFINFSLLFIGAIKSEVILTFLGLGVKDEPSWGLMISASKAEVVNAFFWQIGTATTLMFGLVLAFNIFTDALQDALDPKHIG